MKKLFALVFAALLVMSATSFAEAIQATSIGSGTLETIQETGYGIGPMGANPKSSLYKTYARQAARLDALRLLIADVGGMDVELIDDNPERTTSHVTSKQLKQLKNIRQVGEAKFDEDGICSITLEIVLRKAVDL